MCIPPDEILFETVTLPLTARPIVITNVVTPYLVRIYEVKVYTENLERINRGLLRFVKQGILNNCHHKNKPQCGDFVIVHNTQNLNTNKGVDVPMWWCRGILGDLNPITERYNVQLVDYGTVVELCESDFTVIPKDPIPEAHLTSITGLYNVIPCIKRKTQNSTYSDILILDEWSELAIEFTRSMIAASSATYFEHLTTDKNGRKYGEFYLNIDDKIVALSKSLVINDHAVFLDTDLLQQFHNPACKILTETIGNKVARYIIDCNRTEKCSRNNIYKANGVQNGMLNAVSTKVTYMAPPKVKNYNGLRSNNVERVLVYSNVTVDPLEAVADARFPAVIHRAWETLVRSARPRHIQSYMWPAIKKNLNVVAIGPAQSGKTIGYCVALTAAVVAEKILPAGPKPVALILCSTTSEVFTVHALCAEFLQTYNIKTVGAYNGKPESSIVADMYNGCHILISTPCFLARFLKSNKKVLSFEALRYLVMDNADVILDKYKNALGRLLKHGIMMNRESKDDKIPYLQIIIASKHWTLNLKEFVCVTMYQPYICISSYLEAASFKSIKPTMSLVSSEAKLRKLLDLLKNERMLKVMILCTTAKEAEELNRVLSATKPTLLAHENMTFVYLKGVKECWESYIPGFSPILICTDEVLSDMSISNIDWLIHYSVALNLKSQFNYRFSVLTENLLKNKTDCKVSIIADENDNLQFLSIIGTLQRLGVTIPEKILDCTKRIAVTLDQKKKYHSMCNNIQAFGECEKKHACHYRHCVLAEVDSPTTNVNIGDKVKFVITYIHNATHFSARLIEATTSGTTEKKLYPSNIYMQLSIKLQQFYSIPENRRSCNSINVGSIYAIEEPIGSFKRVQILYLRTNIVDTFGKPKYADIRCIDSGLRLKKIAVSRLWYMPEDTLNLPTFTVDIFIANVAPYDYEPNWNRCADEATDKWFKTNFTEGTYVQGTVCLHLGYTIWTDDLEIGTKLIHYDDIIISSLKSELLKNNHGVINDKHLPHLYNLCKSAGLSLTSQEGLNNSLDEDVSM